MRGNKVVRTRPASAVTWVGDIPAPVTSYASSVTGTSMPSVNVAPASTAWTRSAVVQRKPRRRGMRYFYSYGAVTQPVPQTAPGTRSGVVWNSAFQTQLVQLHDWSQNDAWYIAYPRNLGWSFRVQQLKTQVTGGPGPGRQSAKPLFPRVQRVPRPTVMPQAYKTKSAKE